MKKWLKYVYWLAGATCVGYYFVIGHASRFGLSMSWMWPLAGGVLIMAGFLCLAPLPGWMRVAWRTMLCLGIVLVIGLECVVISGMRSEPPSGLDYLIVLGARVEQDGPSPALRRRLNATLEYLADNPETMVIASGGQGPDEPTTEAACIRDELVAAGIAPERILMEERSTTTAENMAFSAKLISDGGASVGIVTNNYHVSRAMMLAQKAGIENAHGVAAKYTGYTLFHYMVREAACLIADGLMGNL